MVIQPERMRGIKASQRFEDVTDACVFGDEEVGCDGVRDRGDFCLCVGVWLCGHVCVCRGRVRVGVCGWWLGEQRGPSTKRFDVPECHQTFE